MKKILLKLRHLILSILLFGTAFYIQEIALNNENYVIDNASIEKTLHNLETELENGVQKIAEIVRTEKYIENNGHTWLIDEDFTNFREKEITILVYKNDSLKFWSDNSIPGMKLASSRKFDTRKISQIGTALYEVKTKTVGDVKIIGLLRLKNKFSYENKYLKNNFHNDFKLPSSVRISALPGAQGSNIKDKDGKHIFSLFRINKLDTKKEKPGLIAVLYFLGFAFFLVFLNQIFSEIVTDKKYSPLWLSLIILLLIIARFFSIKYRFPDFIYSLDFFDTKAYQGTFPSSNVGDLLINSVLLAFLCANIFKIYNLEKLILNISKNNKILKFTVVVPFSLAVITYAYYIFDIISDLINKSDIPLAIYNILELNFFSLIAYSSAVLLISSFIFLTDRIIRLLKKTLSVHDFFVAFIFTAVISAGLCLALDKNFGIVSFVFAVIIVLIITLIRFKKFKYRYFVYVIFIFLTSAYLVLLVNESTNKKEIENLKKAVVGLIDQRDNVAELLLKEEEKKMSNDTVLIGHILNPSIGQSNLIHDYLERQYFNGFWKKYDLEVTICGESKDFRETNKADNCKKFYENTILKKAEKLENSNYYFVDNHNGTISYWGYISIPEEEDERKITLYIQLNSRIISKELGYPELLLSRKETKTDKLNGYSYAKYTNNKLITVSGNYPYKLADDDYLSEKKYSIIEKDEYTHLVLRTDKNNCIVISTQSPKAVNLLISFAYLFVFLNIITIISIVVIDFRSLTVNFRPDFKNKIRFSMILVLILTFVIFGIVTTYYSVGQQKEFSNSEMSSKIHSVLTEFEHNFSLEDSIDPEWQMGKFNNLNELVTTFSQIFFSDVNLYDLDGFLIATSRPEIFKQELIGRQMNSEAYKKLVIEHKTQVIQNENIGELDYASVYIPFRNHENKVIAYLNLPYFTNPGELQKNVSALLVTVINIYLVLLLLTILIAFFISTKITQPLKMLQDKFKELKLGNKHQEIKYTRDDEIGSLVSEYNRMNVELIENIKKLTETERDTAWREMAKQIAHEIKNPLTPMKLSMQLLQRAWKDKKPDFDSRIDKVSATVIEQIDTLSSIASEFSSFAKMPKAQEEEVNIVAKVDTVVQLFEHTKDTDVSLNIICDKDVRIIADKEQLSRVFINLIKNGIQSVPAGVKGIIKVEIITYAGRIKVTITDNGSGIPDDRKDKLFIPNFTTKTTGMGMGLAIVRNIIKNADGEIWFESEVGVGTSFFVEFPIYNPNKTGF